MENKFGFKEILSPEAAGPDINMESREKERGETLARLVIVRHFPAHYGEVKEIKAQDYDLISTPEQKDKNKRRAKQISRIFGDNEVVAFWTSPRQRAEGTKEVLKRHIHNPLIKEKVISSLQSVKVPPDYYEKFLQENMTGGWFPNYQETPREGRAGTDRVESVGEVARRFKRVFKAFDRFTHKRYSHMDSADKKEITNIIAVTHGEVPNDFLENVFGFGYSHYGDYTKQHLGRGENLVIETRCMPDGVIRHFATMRGRTVAFDFDPQTRSFNHGSGQPPKAEVVLKTPKFD